MNLAEFRKSLGLSQEECARALGLTSKGHISDIENGVRPASPTLALKIERWSSGKVAAWTLNPKLLEVADVRPVRRRRVG
jgi:transcriptional regulator with XRE-family HTH domain